MRPIAAVASGSFFECAALGNPFNSPCLHSLPSVCRDARLSGMGHTLGKNGADKPVQCKLGMACWERLQAAARFCPLLRIV